MSESKSKFVTPLARAKGHGASHSGVGHWWIQRVTAVPLLVLLPWFVISLITSMTSSDVAYVAGWFASPVNALGLSAMIIAMFWHAKLGLQVVIEDYVHTNFAKYSLLLLNNFICWGAGILGTLCVLRLHFIDITSFT